FARSKRAAVHWAKHLDIARRMHFEARWNARLHNLQQCLGDLLRRLTLDEVKVRVALRIGYLWHEALVHAMRASDNPAIRGLAENLREAHHWDRAALD